MVKIIRKIGLPATNERAFNRSINAASATVRSTTCANASRSRKLNGDHPFLRTQLQSSDQRAIVVQSGGRSADLQEASSRFSKFEQTNPG